MRLNATSVLFHRRGWVENKQHISISDISVLCVDQRGSRSSWVSFSTAYTANKQANIQCCFVRSLPPSLHSPSPSLAQDWCVVAGFMCCFRVCVCGRPPHRSEPTVTAALADQHMADLCVWARETLGPKLTTGKYTCSHTQTLSDS